MLPCKDGPVASTQTADDLIILLGTTLFPPVNQIGKLDNFIIEAWRIAIVCTEFFFVVFVSLLGRF